MRKFVIPLTLGSLIHDAKHEHVSTVTFDEINQRHALIGLI